MLADPLALSTVWGRTTAQRGTDFTTPVSFVRTGSSLNSSTYRYTISSTHYVDLFVGNQKSKRLRYTVRLTENEIVADPMNVEMNVVKTSTWYLVVDRSVLGAGSLDTNCLNMLAYFLVNPSDGAALVQGVLAGQT